MDLVITVADGQLLRSPELENIVQDYYATMRGMEPSFIWRNFYWWRDCQRVRLFVARRNHTISGFLIIGFKPYIDEDVSAEICELYSRGSYGTFSALFEAALNNLTPPWGFQVLKQNIRASRLFELFLKRRDVHYRSYESTEGDSAVIKYRIDV